ncbi:MAG TPA: HAD hydrolase family protein [Nitrosospira sp.]|nr:HAD hydrolase family protein [Nitrosospira sp.]
MRWVAVISSGEGGGEKNIARRMAGRPLFAWALEQAIASDCFDDIYIATGSPEICEQLLGELPWAQGSIKILDDSALAFAVGRSSDNMLLPLREDSPFDVLCMIGARCPLTHADDFRTAKDKFLAGNFDSLVTTVRLKRPLWLPRGAPITAAPAGVSGSDGAGEYLMENGAFSIMRATALGKDELRLNDRIGIHEMPLETAIEITDEAGWFAVEQLLSIRKLVSTKARAQQIGVLVLDVDGTLTDAGMYYGPGGEALKKFNTRDAHGLQLLRENGITVCVITTEESPSVQARMRKLQIEEYYPGVGNKFPLLLDLAKRWGVSLQNIGYVGDDLSDLECLRKVGCAFCPADAVPQVKQQVHHICEQRGGHGAVREVCDLILEAKESATGNISAPTLASTSA